MVIRPWFWFLEGICILVFIIGVLFVSSEIVSAEEIGIVPACPANDPNCSDPYSPDNYGSCEFVSLINNVVRFLIGIASVFATIIFVYAGYLLVVSQGNPSNIEKAKGHFLNVLIGYIILLAAFLIVNTILSMMVGSTSSLLNWNQIQCSYANQVGTPSRVIVSLEDSSVVSFDLADSVVDRYSGTVSGGSPGSGNGTCAAITDTGNECYPGNLSCFGSFASQASMVCNVESRGGAGAVSGTDLCIGGKPFSGGLFQINILAHYSKLPGCSNDFFTKVGSGVQGDCLVEREGYCAVRNCEITNEPVYNACMQATFDPSINKQIACDLFQASGYDFGPWKYTAQKCGLSY